ncbi:MAG TPA: hypothetical protein VKN63_01380 [Afifellaceae bacterium]|nr:hypothetical protein [Afifellaceae bacterium]
MTRRRQQLSLKRRFLERMSPLSRAGTASSQAFCSVGGAKRGRLDELDEVNRHFFLSR